MKIILKSCFICHILEIGTSNVNDLEYQLRVRLKVMLTKFQTFK